MMSLDDYMRGIRKMELGKMEEADKVDHFARIPDELLILILRRLENLKFIFACSLVSKRFASTIYQIKSVSMTLPSNEIPSAASADEINELFLKLAGFTSEEILRFIQSSSIKELKFFSFLRTFRELRSISLVFTCPRSVCSSSLFKMKVKFSSGGAMVTKFVSLIANSVCKITERGYNHEHPCSNQSISDTFLPFGCCTMWLLVLCLLVKCQPLLESITITDCRKQGKLVLRDEQLVAWRNNLVPGGLLNDFTPYSCTSGWICKLRMPLTGYMLNGVKYIIARPWDEPDSDGDNIVDDGGAITWEYSGGRLLADALSEFIIQYGDPLIISELAY